MLRPRAVPLGSSPSRVAFSLLLTGCVLGSLGCGGPRASSVPLGGAQEQDSSPDRTTAAPAAAAPSEAPDSDGEGAADAEEVAVEADAGTESSPPAAPAAPGGFQVRPYSAGQSWTRVFDAEFEVKLGPAQAIEMRMVNHQEARFEVLAASAGNIDKLGIEYLVDTATITMMGQEQNDPQELAGKRYVVTFAQGKPDVRSAGGGTPPKKELDSVKDDAREPFATLTALKELAALTVKGQGDFSTAGAVALAGGEDDDTKVTGARASLRQLSSSARGERSALLDVAYTLTSTADPDLAIELQLAGSMVVLDAPSRYASITLRGPITLRPPSPGGMEGRGTSKVTLSYKY